MTTDQSAVGNHAVAEPIRWAWVVAGTVLGAILITIFIRLVDPGLQSPGVDGLVVTLSLLLVGVLVGNHSAGETIRETALSGVALILLAAILAAGVFGVRIPGLVWIAGPFYAATVTMVGGYVGELLQGTLEEAHIDEAIDWPWVLVAVVIGFTLSTYAVFLLRALVNSSPSQDLLVFAASFFVTGLVVGYFSPGITMVEPAIASAGMTVLYAGFIYVWFDTPPSFTAIAGSLVGGITLGLLGGWMGEALQKLRGRNTA